jgi:hypothetical protein
MAPYIDAWFALCLVIFGLSHAARPRLWGDFIDAIRSTGFAPFIIGVYTLPTGLFILIAHNQWSWDWPVLVTVSGWALTIKATTYLLFPAASDRLIRGADRWRNDPSGFRVAGALMSVAGALLTWQAFQHLPA